MKAFEFIKERALFLYIVRWLAILIFIVHFISFGQTKSEKSSDLILKSANSNENSFTNGKLVSVLRGNVVFLYEDVTISADEAVWWRDDGIINFRNNVKIAQKSQTLTCDRINFIKKENRVDAIGKFKYRDSLELVELTGDKGTYWTNTKFFKLTGSPKLIRMDKTTPETLTIISKTMSYLDSIKTAYAEENVVISKGKLKAHCQKAIYHTEKNIAYLRLKPNGIYDVHTIVGDSIDLYFSKEALRSAIVLGNANAFYKDTSVKTGDTAFTKIWGDTIYMSVSDSGNLDTIKIIGKALSTYYLASKPNAVNRAEGKRITMFFNKNSNLDKIKIWGNAKSLYYVEDVSNSGINEASGDSIIVYFSKGKASSLTFAGSVRGRFYPEIF
ncbi:MAG: hypothetical protein N2053_06110 [Chitinispirillaceae bacterium]|nr:hypothetical protein [Chitinispirillaceae bacterium]